MVIMVHSSHVVCVYELNTLEHQHRRQHNTSRNYKWETQNFPSFSVSEKIVAVLLVNLLK